MNQAAQQISPDPARRLADKILARTNNGRDLIDLLHDISQGGYDAPKSDRITASNFLVERGFGKCPRQSSATNPDPEHSPATDDNDVGALREAPSAVAHKEPESPRLVTQIGDALHDALGPAPKACPEPVAEARSEQAGPEDEVSSEPFDPTSIQEYIIEITNDGETLVDSLMEIAYADDDDPTVTPRHRSRAGRILADRFMGTNPTAVQSGLCPSCRRKWTTHPGSHNHPEPSQVVGETEEEPFDKEVWEGIIAELKQMEEDGLITPDPDAPEVDMSAYNKWTDEEIAPYAAEEAAKFRAEIKLRLERQKEWPEIEERRRKKLAKIYPSHIDGKPPDT